MSRPARPALTTRALPAALLLLLAGLGACARVEPLAPGVRRIEDGAGARLELQDPRTGNWYAAEPDAARGWRWTEAARRQRFEDRLAESITEHD